MDNNVKGVQMHAFAIGEGLMSTMYRVTVQYQRPPANGLRDTFVAKISPPGVKPRIIGDVLNLFGTEVNYYKKGLKSSTGMDSPTCYYAGSTTNGRYCILLEDLPGKSGKQLDGVSLEHARQAVRCLARLHARYLGKTRSDPTVKDWLLKQDDLAYYELVKKAYIPASQTMQDRITNVFKTQKVEGLADLSVKFGENYEKWKNLVFRDNQAVNPKSNMRLTLTHGDFRAENMFFDVPTTIDLHSGAPKEDSVGMRLVDFQLLKEASGPSELCYFIGSSLQIEDRKQYEVELIRLYHAELKVNGAEMSMLQILLYYQAGLANGMLINTIAQKDTQLDSARAQELCRITQQRMWSQQQDWNYEAHLDVMFTHTAEEIIGRAWTEEELRSFIPDKYLALRGVDEVTLSVSN
jgi:hypothetical protein